MFSYSTVTEDNNQLVSRLREYVKYGLNGPYDVTPSEASEQFVTDYEAFMKEFTTPMGNIQKFNMTPFELAQLEFTAHFIGLSTFPVLSRPNKGPFKKTRGFLKFSKFALFASKLFNAFKTADDVYRANNGQLSPPNSFNRNVDSIKEFEGSLWSPDDQYDTVKGVGHAILSLLVLGHTNPEIGARRRAAHIIGKVNGSLYSESVALEQAEKIRAGKMIPGLRWDPV